jgi:hypothetical protein
MISTEQQAFLQNLHDTRKLFDQMRESERQVRHFALGAVYLHGWRLHRLWRNPSSPPSTGMIIRGGDRLDEITAAASILLWECASVKAAHEQLLICLGEMQSNAVRHDDKRETGDILFTLADALFLFSRANMVVLVRNAGARKIELADVASTIDLAILRHVQKNGST